MSIISPDLLQRFNKRNQKGSFPSCLVRAVLSSWARHLVKMEGVEKAFEELSNSQKLHNWPEMVFIFLLSVEVFSVFFDFYTDF